MISTEQWLLQIAQSSRLPQSTCQELWLRLVQLLQGRLILAQPIYMNGVGLWRTESYPPKIALLPDGERILLPPAAIPVVEFTDRPIWREEVGELLATMTDQKPESVDLFYKSLVSLFRMHEGRRHNLEWQPLGRFCWIEEEEAYAFYPSEVLLESINRPYQMFSPTPLKPGVGWDDIEAKEVVTIDELRPTSVSLRRYPHDESNEQILTADPDDISSLIPDAQQIETEEPIVVADNEPVTNKPKERGLWEKWKPLAIVFLLAMVILWGGYYAYQAWFDSSSKTTFSVSQMSVAPLRSIDTLPHVATDSTSLTVDSILTIEVVDPGEYLAQYAKKYLGSPYFWIYIYLANRGQIDDPDNVPIGTRIKIPTPESLGITAVDQESIDRASALALQLSLETT